MPFTPAHPLLVLPLRRTRLPLSALLAGSTVPDLPVFAQAFGAYGWTHSVVGVLLVDPVLTVVVLAVWFAWVRDPLVDLLPDFLRSRLPASARLDRAEWAWVLPAGAVGALTHVLWDELTHPGRWGTEHVAVLAERHGPLIGATWLQYASGLLGTLAVLGFLATWFARQDVVGGRRPARRLPRSTWFGIVLVPVVVGAALLVTRLPDGLHAMAFDTVVGAIVAGAVTVGCLVGLWHGARARS
ncbi:hypothetical protein ASD11_06950 [Aeromicrobium sp. Root495]|uniref:DUF4184 family protein n=1 Tax=Aeromicrobium sp. Root495 TaxID=1736550 RepID=UPI000701821D|nr:DUF4184 family protein [Aeromicrobium sp. Root495]KQY59306.1 hypothetical protein ASD11_06950 [Aeromicrobium sp. Root495]